MTARARRIARGSLAATAIVLPLGCTLLVDLDGFADGSNDGGTTAADRLAPDIGSDAGAAEGGVGDASDAALRDAPQGAVFWPNNGHSYLVVTQPTAIGWGEAKLRAELYGGHLATIGSAEENAFVFTLAADVRAAWNDKEGPWLGGVQPPGSTEPDGGWSWVTSEPWTFHAWGPSEPNDTGGGQQVLQYQGDQALWDDTDSANEFVRSYIVEFE